MAAAEPDPALEARLGLPGPPYRIFDSRPLAVLIPALLVLGLLPVLGAGILVAYFGFSAEGRTLLVDTALAAGAGESLLQARVTVGTCRSYRTTGRYGSSGHDCPITVADGTEVAQLSVDLYRPEIAQEHRGAARAFGRIGLRWPLRVVAERWLSVALLLIAGIGLIALPLVLGSTIGGVWRRSAARRGRARAVDLLSWSGKPWFAFVDGRGRQRIVRDTVPGAPLVIDAPSTRGIALVNGGSAVLVKSNLFPLLVDDARRDAVIAAATAMRAHDAMPSAPFHSLPIEAIESRLGAASDETMLASLYAAAWRLGWDTDATRYRRAIAVRERIGERLGPEATLAALRAARAVA